MFDEVFEFYLNISVVKINRLIRDLEVGVIVVVIGGLGWRK